MTTTANLLSNADLRLTEPVWKEEVDTGGMFSGRLAVHVDPNEGVPLRYLAVAGDGWGGGKQGRRATLEEAKAAARTFAEEQWG